MMQKDNLQLLRTHLRHLGFGEGVTGNDQLERNMQQGVAAFQLSTAACFDEWTTLQATLFFQKTENLDIYSFSKYTAHLIYPTAPTNNKMQTFYIKNGSGVTFKEAFNLLQGRAVYKTLLDTDGTKYSAWIQLSFTERSPDNSNHKVRQFSKAYGYDLETVLKMYPIRELQDADLKQNLLHSLQKGNIHPATLLKSNKTEKLFIAACPEYKTITIFSEIARLLQKPPNEN